MAKIIIKKRADIPHYSSSTVPMSKRGQEDGGGCLCFALGFLFSVIGILIAALIGKRSGVISALWGMIVGTIFLGIVWFILFMIGGIL